MPMTGKEALKQLIKRVSFLEKEINKTDVEQVIKYRELTYKGIPLTEDEKETLWQFVKMALKLIRE